MQPVVARHVIAGSMNVPATLAFKQLQLAYRKPRGFCCVCLWDRRNTV